MRTLPLSFLIAALLIQTTISNVVIACGCLDGILIGSDSLSVSGSLVGSRVAESIFPLGTNTVICCAAGHSDFHRLICDLKGYIRSADNSRGGSLKSSSIARYARRLMNQKYRNTHVIIAGYCGEKSSGKKRYPNDDDNDGGSSRDDESDGSGCDTSIRGDGDHQFDVHEILSGGTLISQSYALAGSGSDCVITLMDDIFTPYTSTLSSGGVRTVGNSVDNIRRVLRACIAADPKSGSQARIWILNEHGLKLL
jgi:20S proteasome alpha/beta subunit